MPDGGRHARLVASTTGCEVCRAVQLWPKPTLSQIATASHLGQQMAVIPDTNQTGTDNCALNATQRTRGLDFTYACAADTFRSIRESESSMDLLFLVACQDFPVQR